MRDSSSGSRDGESRLNANMLPVALWTLRNCVTVEPCAGRAYYLSYHAQLSQQLKGRGQSSRPQVCHLDYTEL